MEDQHQAIEDTAVDRDFLRHAPDGKKLIYFNFKEGKRPSEDAIVNALTRHSDASYLEIIFGPGESAEKPRWNIFWNAFPSLKTSKLSTYDVDMISRR